MSRRIIPRPLPYSLDTLKAVSRAPALFRKHTTAATAGKIGALAFCLMHLHKSSRGDPLTSHNLYEFYAEFCRGHEAPILGPFVFGRELSRWHRLATNQEIRKERLRMNGRDVRTYPAIRYSDTPLDMTAHYTGTDIEKLDIQVARTRRSFLCGRSRKLDYSQKYIDQVRRNPSNYKSFLDGEPPGLAAAAAFCEGFLEVPQHNASKLPITSAIQKALARRAADFRVLTGTAYQAYKAFCARSDHPIISNGHFGREVSRYWQWHGKGRLRISRCRDSGTRRRAYEGIRLKVDPKGMRGRVTKLPAALTDRPRGTGLYHQARAARQKPERYVA